MEDVVPTPSSSLDACLNLLDQRLLIIRQQLKSTHAAASQQRVFALSDTSQHFRREYRSRRHPLHEVLNAIGSRAAVRQSTSDGI
ncbi:hypothetical protein [Amycolatopsis sp. cmx-8-4]|uniref:hypothetical protein n=1 Tax=Amycolatopsis sp. cmx-8-4 TaxID=2790947 RepID=UPI00397BFC7F